jgi:hypothetical protein
VTSARVLLRDEASQLMLLGADTDGAVPLEIEDDVGALEPPTDVVVLGFGTAGEPLSSVGHTTGWTEDRQGFRAVLDTEPGFAGAPVVSAAGRVVGMAHARLPDGARELIAAPTVTSFLDTHSSGRP